MKSELSVRPSSFVLKGQTKMNVICEKCGKRIPQARLDVLPNTTTCVACSSVKPMVGFMDWYHKTAPELVMVSTGDTENLRRAQRINARAR